jgi:hypothetical protein
VSFRAENSHQQSGDDTIVVDDQNGCH